MTTLNPLERYLQLDHSYNVRDVGGYPAHGGRHVRWRKLLRSDSLHALTPASQQALRDHGLRTIVDLRRPSEARQKPNVFATAEGLIYRNMPLFDDDIADVVDAPAESLEELYIRYIDMCQAQFGAIMRAVVEASAAPLLVHCAVGKDRTGMVVGLTLGALGVAPDTIADDYALSYPRLAPLFELERPTIPAERRANFDRMIQSPRETMEHVIAHLDQRYGGFSGYLETIGITADQIEQLRANLLQTA
jgi:protein-tyrosine phosphatase